MQAAVSTNFAAQVGALVAGLLALYAGEHRLGFVTGAGGGYVVRGQRQLPDAAFISRHKQARPSRAAYNPLPPDLAVEILSPNRDLTAMRQRVANYLAAGAVVWLIHPQRQRAEIYLPGGRVRRVGLNDWLDAPDVLPGFAVRLRDVFPPRAL